MAAQPRVDLLDAARRSLPSRLNAGILFGDGGFCVLGWMLAVAGFHPITFYANTVAVVDPQVGGPAVDVVARAYGLDRDTVQALGELNDGTPGPERHAAVRARMDDLVAELGGAEPG